MSMRHDRCRDAANNVSTSKSTWVVNFLTGADFHQTATEAGNLAAAVRGCRDAHTPQKRLVTGLPVLPYLRDRAGGHSARTYRFFYSSASRQLFARGLY